MYMGLIDVRDLADLHRAAMTHPAAAGQRFLGVFGASVSLFETAAMLRRRLEAAAAKAPTKQMPDLLVRVIGLFNAQARLISRSLGLRREASGRRRGQSSARPLDLLKTRSSLRQRA